MISQPPPSEHDDLVRAALRVIEADHYPRENDPHADAESEYATEQLALAARAYARAVDALPQDLHPIGWSKDTSPAAPTLARLRSAVEKLANDFGAHLNAPGDRAMLEGWGHGLAQAITALDQALADGDDAISDDSVGVGSVSPTRPAALGEWLRALPLQTILRDRTFNPCQRETGEEHRHRAPEPRWFPALYVFGDPFEITEGHEQIESLARHNAPFTVLAVGGAENDGRKWAVTPLELVDQSSTDKAQLGGEG